MQSIGFIGAGNVGVSLGRYISESNIYKICGYYSRSTESAEYASSVTNSKTFTDMESLVNESDIIFITTPDDVIKTVWSGISDFNIQNKIICHCSGSLSSEIFFDISLQGGKGASLHPLMAVSSKDTDLGDAFFTIEGDSDALDVLVSILKTHHSKYKILNKNEKTKYHLACVFSSNMVLSLFSTSFKILEECGFNDREIKHALENIAKKNIEKLFSTSLEQSITGPVERNDTGTVEKHLDCIKNNIDTIDCKNLDMLYRLLSENLINIAESKNRERNYLDLKKILEV